MVKEHNGVITPLAEFATEPGEVSHRTRAGDAMREVLLKATDLVNHGTRVLRESEQDRADRLLYGNLRKVS